MTFSVMPKSGQTTGTTITNQAMVVFDSNAPMNTPSWLNTLDVDAPHSSVTALLAVESGTTFNVSWSGNGRTAPGLQHTLCSYPTTADPTGSSKMQMSTTSAAFTGQSGHTYSFYSIATDGAGNVEAAKKSPDTTTTVPSATTTASSLAISKTSPADNGGHFSQGQTDATYTLTVSNTGVGPTTLPISVTDNGGAGLTVKAMSGAGWALHDSADVHVCGARGGLGRAGQSAHGNGDGEHHGAGAVSPMAPR